MSADPTRIVPFARRRPAAKATLGLPPKLADRFGSR